MRCSKKKFLSAWATCLFLLIPVAPISASSRGVPIKNVAPIPHLAPSGTSLDAIAVSITASAGIRNWKVTRVEPGLLTAETWVRHKHRAVVQIGFDEDYFWIDYLDSENLNYRKFRNRPGGNYHRRERAVQEGPFIHPNYNRWVRKLSSTIQERGITPNQNKAREVSESLSAWKKSREVDRDAPLIADEIRKLNLLREEGVLTQEEFENYKKRLLSN